MKPIRIASALIALLVVLIAPRAAEAHLHLRESLPAASDTLETAPTTIRLTFTEAVELGFSDISVLGPLGEVRLGELVVPIDSPAVLEVSIVGGLAPGTYTVRWQAASADGHPMRGEFTFTLPAGAAGLAPTDTTPPPGARSPSPVREAGFSVQSPAYTAVRWGTFVALLAVIGAVAFRLLVLAPLADDREMVSLAAGRAARLGLWAAALLLVAAFLRLAAESLALTGTMPDGKQIGEILFGTIWGAGWLLQIGGSLVALAGFLLARRAADIGWLIAALAAVALSFFPALSGHAVAVAPRRLPAVVADGLHVFAAGGWLGSLLFVLVAGLPIACRGAGRRTGEGLVRLIAAFSPTALAFASILLLTGVVTSWMHLGSLAALTGTPYGKTLLAKLAVVAVVGAAGLSNWRRTRRRSASDLPSDEVALRLRRSAAFELAAALLVLVITAALVATPLPPH